MDPNYACHHLFEAHDVEDITLTKLAQHVYLRVMLAKAQVYFYVTERRSDNAQETSYVSDARSNEWIVNECRCHHSAKKPNETQCNPHSSYSYFLPVSQTQPKREKSVHTYCCQCQNKP